MCINLAIRRAVLWRALSSIVSIHSTVWALYSFTFDRLPHWQTALLINYASCVGDAWAGKAAAEGLIASGSARKALPVNCLAVLDDGIGV